MSTQLRLSCTLQSACGLLGPPPLGWKQVCCPRVVVGPLLLSTVLWGKGAALQTRDLKMRSCKGKFAATAALTFEDPLCASPYA